MKVGCFEVEQLSPFRWRVTNQHTTLEHVTYGPEHEVREQLEIQTKAWEERMKATKGRWRMVSLGGRPREQAPKVKPLV